MSDNFSSKKDPSEILQLVSFKIGPEEFGIDILQVQEINKVTSVTKIPNSPSFIEGVLNLRGRVIPIIDLRLRLNLEKIAHTSNTRIIVVNVRSRTVGFIVDAVSEVLRIPDSIIEEPPLLITGINTEFISSVVKMEDRILILIDLEKIISLDNYNNVEKVL